MTGLIFGLVVVAGIGILGYVVYYQIKRKIERLSVSMFGTKNFINGYEKQMEELSTTPKSVTGMTRLMEPQIQRDFPDFNWLQFRDKAENMLISALQAIEERNPLLVTEASEEVKNQITNRIHLNETEGITEVFDRIKIHQTEIANYEKKQGKCVIKLQSAVEYIHYKKKDGQMIEGSEDRLEQTRYNVELLYVQNTAIAGMANAVGTTCPNCGAPITNLGAKFCEYCGSAVEEINIKVWSLHSFYEVDYHRM
ncbi:MAG: TIM44-like domain-containing protein [Roseburia sp.]